MFVLSQLPASLPRLENGSLTACRIVPYTYYQNVVQVNRIYFHRNVNSYCLISVIILKIRLFEMKVRMITFITA